MSLEVATHISDLDSNNPTATDKKNQGDDHFRLVKAVLKTTFPNADRPFRFPEVLNKSANYTVLSTDDNKTIVCDTTVAFTLTLPTPTIDGWNVRVMKTTLDANPVFVSPPSGTINGVAKIRINVPFIEHVFFWTGTAFVRQNVESRAGTFEDYGGASAPVGWAFPTGQSLVRLDYPELFAAWSTTWGAVDSTHFNAPDLRDKFITQAGSTYALAATGGEATHALTIAELATHSHGVTQTPHDHAITGKEAANGTVSGAAPPVAGLVAAGGNPDLDVQSANANITIDNTGSSTAHENRPPYTALNRIFRLC